MRNIFPTIKHHCHRNIQRGNALILVLIALPAIIGAAGLALDWGRGVWTKTRLQKAADAAALAGSSFLPYQTVADQRADSVIDSNFGVPTSQTLTANGYSYTVSLTEDVPSLLMRIFGHDTMNITAHATALAHRLVGVLKGHGFPSAIINPNLNNDP